MIHVWFHEGHSPTSRAKLSITASSWPKVPASQLPKVFPPPPPPPQFSIGAGGKMYIDPTTVGKICTRLWVKSNEYLTSNMFICVHQLHVQNSIKGLSELPGIPETF